MYTVCARIVDDVVMQSNGTSSLVILILVFALLIAVIQEVAEAVSKLQVAPTPGKRVVPDQTEELKNLVQFTVGVCLNVAVQFESTLVANVAVTTLKPTSAHAGWVMLLSAISLMMLWILNESRKAM